MHLDTKPDGALQREKSFTHRAQSGWWQGHSSPHNLLDGRSQQFVMLEGQTHSYGRGIADTALLKLTGAWQGGTTPLEPPASDDVEDRSGDLA
jgi:hypothetical protein